jgi:hypothetical protein
VEYQFHPIADLFPLMEGADFNALVAGIKKNGFLDGNEIRTFEEKILDGRNRYRACLKAGVPPRFKPWNGDDPYSFVTSMNLHRRNMSIQERAFVAEAMATMRQGQKKADRPVGLSDTSVPEAAALLNVSTKSVQRARVIKNEGDETLVADVKSGDVSLRAAADKILATRPKETNKRKRLLTRHSHVPCEGMKRCEEAESAMNRIQIDDRERAKAFAHLRRWCDAHE